MKKKTITLLIALVLVLTCAVGGTLAWLTDKSGPVTNTFSTSDIDIELSETTTNYQMIPGYDISKDPKVTVKANSEKCYVFVEFIKEGNFDHYMTYTVDSAVWTKLNVADKEVYYKIVDKTASDVELTVLNENKVTVKDTVTKGDMTTAKATAPTLTFKAYASQFMKNNTENFTAEQAWANIQ